MATKHTVAEWERAISYADWERFGVGAGKSPRWKSVAAAFSSRKKAISGAPATYIKQAKSRFSYGFKQGRLTRVKNPNVRMGLKSAIPAKFVTAKVRRVGNKVQILLNK